MGRTGRFGTYGLSITFITLKTKEMDLLNNYIQTLNSKINKLPQDLKTIINKKYLNYSLILKNDSDKKQFEVFQQKREKLLNDNKNKISDKLRQPSTMIK